MSYTVAEVLVLLTTKWDANTRTDAILFDGRRIGSLVSYGSNSGKITGNLSSRTVYGSRIYAKGLRIEEEGSTRASLLHKVSRALAKAIRDGKYEVVCDNAGENEKATA